MKQSQQSPGKGRGAVVNVRGRFEADVREAVDDGWFHEEGAAEPLRTTVTDEQARSIISRNDSPDIGFDQSLNPYRGCEHGCVYCYARPNHSYVGLSPGLDFETRLFAKINAAALLVDELSARSYRCSPIAVGMATDAYQPIERDRRLTRQCLQVLHDCDHPVTTVTKSSLVERDIDLLAPMAARGLACVYVTITTLDPELARRLEPRAAAPWRRLETVRRLAQAGIPVGVSIAPVIPFVNEPELERIVSAAREAGALHAHYVLLRLPHELRTVFRDWLRRHYPQREDRVLHRLQDMRGGRDNDPRFGSRMRGEGVFADMIRMRFARAARQAGLAPRRLDLRTDLFRPPTAAGGQLGLF